MDHLPVRRAEKRRDRVDAGVFLWGGWMGESCRGVGWRAVDAFWVENGWEWGFGEMSFMDVGEFCLGVLPSWGFWGISVQREIQGSPQRATGWLKFFCREVRGGGLS